MLNAKSRRGKGVMEVLLLGILLLAFVPALAQEEPIGEIAFVSDRDGNREIYLMNADGSNQRNLTDNPSDDMYPVWSPDGSQIAFTSGRDGQGEIYVMDADGTNLRNLTNNPGHDFLPSWSPDGRKLLFGECDIFVANSDLTGQNLIRIDHDFGTDTEGLPCMHSFAWSPDGQYIAFGVHVRGAADNDKRNGLYIMQSNGENVRQIAGHSNLYQIS